MVRNLLAEVKEKHIGVKEECDMQVDILSLISLQK